jgi:hypothetical protein
MCLNKAISRAWGFLKTPTLLEKAYLYFLILIVPLLVYPLQVNGARVTQRKIRELGVISIAIILTAFLERSKWLRYLIIWCVINWWINFFIPQNSLNGLLDIFSFFLIYVGIKYCIEKKILNIDILLKLFCVDMIFQMCWAGMQLFNFDPVFYPINANGVEATRVIDFIGWSGNPALFATYLVMGSFLLLHFFKFKKFPLLLIPLFLCLWKLRNFTSLLALCCGVGFYILSNKNYKINKIFAVSLVVILLAILGFSLKSPNFDRLPVWQYVWENIKHKPLWGMGINAFSNLKFVDKTTTPWLEVHNDYLQIILETGFIGFILFLGFLTSSFKRFYKFSTDNKQVAIASCLIVYLVCMFPMFPMHLAQMSFRAVVLLACLESSYGSSYSFTKSS